jgi:transcriptional regulator with XRE-family HTH domain
MSMTDPPGAKLKALRKERRLTLNEVSARTAIPVSTLSKVENGKMYLTYDKLQALSTGLGIEVGLLFNNPPPPTPTAASGRRSVHRLGEGRAVETHLNSYLHLASELRNKQFIPLLTEVRARSMKAFGEMLSHTGEEFTFVLEGSLEVHSELYAPLELQAGESVFFDSGMPHAYIATSAGPCRILTICSSTEAQLFQAVDRSRPRQKQFEAARVATAPAPAPRATKAAAAPAKRKPASAAAPRKPASATGKAKAGSKAKRPRSD